jgi:hypothetical protein
MAWVAKASSSQGVVATAADGAPIPCLLEEGRLEPPLSTRSHVELLDGVLYHGPQWGWWPVVGWAHEDGAWVILQGREAQATEVVGDELKTPKVNGFTEEEATARQTFTIGGDGECQ